MSHVSRDDSAGVPTVNPATFAFSLPRLPRSRPLPSQGGILGCGVRHRFTETCPGLWRSFTNRKHTSDSPTGAPRMVMRLIRAELQDLSRICTAFSPKNPSCSSDSSCALPLNGLHQVRRLFVHENQPIPDLETIRNRRVRHIQDNSLLLGRDVASSVGRCSAHQRDALRLLIK